MAASKRKRQRKADKKARQERAQRDRDTQTSHQALHQRDDRHVLIAMTLASLVAGLLAIVNLDRAANAAH